MFFVENKKDESFEKIILRDDIVKTSVEIIPSSGAILHAFTVLQNGQKVNVVDSYQNAEDFKKNVTEKGFLGCKLSPFVCRINKGDYHFQKRNYHIQKFYSEGHALHGLLYDQSFYVIDKGACGEKAFVTMNYEYKANDSGYPFKYDCLVTYELEKENKLNITTEVINKDSVVIPLQDGWHPYFKLGDKIDDLQFQFSSNELVQFNNDLIPTGKLIPYEQYWSLREIENEVFDNCFTLNFTKGQPACILKSLESKLQIEIYPEESYPYLQIYTPSHRKSIALENLSSVPDGFNNGIGLKILAPGESANFKTSYKIAILS